MESFLNSKYDTCKKNAKHTCIHITSKAMKAPGEPADVTVVLLQLFICNEQQRFLAGLIVARRRQRQPVVPIKIVVVVHVRLTHVHHHSIDCWNMTGQFLFISWLPLNDWSATCPAPFNHREEKKYDIRWLRKARHSGSFFVQNERRTLKTDRVSSYIR